MGTLILSIAAVAAIPVQGGTTPGGVAETAQTIIANEVDRVPADSGPAKVS